MDVFFETSTGKFFSLEVGFFDTVRDIKDKVHKHHGFPVSAQTLVFQGQVMANDDRDVDHYRLLHNSCVHLVLSAAEDRARFKLVVNLPGSKRQLALEAERAESVGKLKERVRVLGGISSSRFTLVHGGVELAPEQRALGECGIGDGSRVSVAAAARPTEPAPRRLRAMLLPRAGMKRVAVEVNAAECAGALRKEMQKLRCGLNLSAYYYVPMENYFFIHGNNAMEEDKSFAWHDVRDGDTIEVFDGSILGAFASV
ncbi:hypothetical protein Cni_G17995 [Canna indica]|uniref:Ubiquitin-like domain-containing protein n=1 Tax=Canna indica TaxID=4628 RepID=A0AAQ3KNK9_9LILI|nr:hypothetical protein Cni_G17995 [Canna indica]